MGSLREAFCLPLEARLHQGFAPLDAGKSSPTDRDTQGVMLVQMDQRAHLRRNIWLCVTPCLTIGCMAMKKRASIIYLV